MPTLPRCSRHSAAAGGTARMSPWRRTGTYSSLLDPPRPLGPARRCERRARALATLRGWGGVFAPASGGNRRSAERTNRTSLDLFEFLQRAQIGGVRLARIDLRPSGPRNLADIDVAVPVDREPVRCEELAELGAGRRVTKPADQFAPWSTMLTRGPRLGMSRLT